MTIAEMIGQYDIVTTTFTLTGGTDTLATKNPRRAAILFGMQSATGAGITPGATPTATQALVRVYNGNSPVVISCHDTGPLASQEWRCRGTAGEVVTITEIVEIPDR